MVVRFMRSPQTVKLPRARPRSRPSPLHYLVCSVLGNWIGTANGAGRRDDISATGAHRFLPILMLTCIALEERGVRLGVSMHFENYITHGGWDFAKSPTIRRAMKQCGDRYWIEVAEDGQSYTLAPLGLAEVLNGSFQDSLWLVSPQASADGGWHDGVFINDPFGKDLIQEAAAPWFLASDFDLRTALARSAFRLAASTECSPYHDFDEIYYDAAEAEYLL